jgi:hypothetical protein
MTSWLPKNVQSAGGMELDRVYSTLRELLGDVSRGVFVYGALESVDGCVSMVSLGSVPGIARLRAVRLN